MKINVLVMVAFALFFQTAQAAIITTDPVDSTVGFGDIFSIDVIGIGFPETEGGGFNLNYDSTVLNVNSVSIDTGTWNFVNSTGTIDNVLGELNLVLVSTTSASADLIVATIEFLAVGSGVSDLTLTEATVNPWSSGGELIDTTFATNSSVTVVPIPATVWLFGSGLIGLIGLARGKVYY